MTHTPNFSAVRVLESTLELEEVGYIASTETRLCSLSLPLSLGFFLEVSCKSKSVSSKVVKPPARPEEQII